MSKPRGRPQQYDEPTVQIGVRLPESLIAKMDAERGEKSRGRWIYEALAPESRNFVKPVLVKVEVAPVRGRETQEGCQHKTRKSLGYMVRCADCGAKL